MTRREKNERSSVMFEPIGRFPHIDSSPEFRNNMGPLSQVPGSNWPGKQGNFHGADYRRCGIHPVELLLADFRQCS
jgi:hypothetical protein